MAPARHLLHAIKRHDFGALRSLASKGRRITIAKNSAGLYFVFRPKSNTRFQRCGFTEYDKASRRMPVRKQ